MEGWRKAGKEKNKDYLGNQECASMIIFFCCSGLG
jgi:hypothetical protein